MAADLNSRFGLQDTKNKENSLQKKNEKCRILGKTEWTCIIPK
jgi:hypothetical protein